MYVFTQVKNYRNIVHSTVYWESSKNFHESPLQEKIYILLIPEVAQGVACKALILSDAVSHEFATRLSFICKHICLLHQIYAEIHYVYSYVFK